MHDRDLQPRTRNGFTTLELVLTLALLLLSVATLYCSR